MPTMNELIQEYTQQLSKGSIQKAYRGIMAFMSDLRSDLIQKYPDFAVTGLYFGYMDMTYFAFTPANLKDKKLKIAIVYLHEENSFEVWLGGVNRKVQAEYIQLLSDKDLGGYTLSKVEPGVDAIIFTQIMDHPDFDHPEALKAEIEEATLEFINNINQFLEN